jgi:phospholipid transport system substrate-binding protein
MNRFILLTFSATALVCSTIAYMPSAHATAATSSAHAAQQTKEQAFVQGVSEEVLKIIRAKAGDAETKKQLEGIFNHHIDIEWVGRFVLARHWNNASEEQKQRFMQSYRNFMIGSYTKRLRDYAGEQYSISTPRAIGNGRSVLTMKVQRPEGGSPILIDYKIRQSGEQFKIYDLVVEGISLISTQRSEFDSVVNRKGIEFLIDALNKKSKTT